MRCRSHGYTLIELLVVLGVIGLLAAMAMPLSEVTAQRERERELKRALWELRDAIDEYHEAALGGAIPVANGGAPFPPDLLALTQAYPDQRAEHRGEVHRFLRRVPRNPFADPALPPEQGWGLRSYLSEADNPQPGADVYDVYAPTASVGLNGVPLKQW